MSPAFLTIKRAGHHKRISDKRKRAKPQLFYGTIPLSTSAKPTGSGAAGRARFAPVGQGGVCSPLKEHGVSREGVSGVGYGVKAAG